MSKDRMLFEHTLRILQDNVLWSNQGERDNLISRIKSFLKEPIDDRKIWGKG